MWAGGQTVIVLNLHDGLSWDTVPEFNIKRTSKKDVMKNNVTRYNVRVLSIKNKEKKY